MLSIECISAITDRLGNQLCGEVLTVIEAILPDRKQAESAKALVKQAIWRNVQSCRDHLIETNTDEEVK